MEEYIGTLIWALTVLIGWILSIIILKSKLHKISFSWKKKEAELDLSGNSDQGPMSITLSSKKTEKEIQKLDNISIAKDIKLIEEENNNEYFKFTTKLERYVSIVDGKEHRKLRFRLGVLQSESRILNISLKGYLVVSKIIKHPSNIGWGSNWPEIKLGKDYLPALTDYWSVDHEIDSEIITSPLRNFRFKNDIINISIKIYATGYLETGQKVFGSQQYNLDEKNCIYGKFKLREITEKTISDEAFDTIIPIEEKGDWGFLKLTTKNNG